jgi:hypothetical protein
MIGFSLCIAIDAGLSHLAIRHARHRRRLSLAHQDARRSHGHAIPGKTE